MDRIEDCQRFKFFEAETGKDVGLNVCEKSKESTPCQQPQSPINSSPILPCSVVSALFELLQALHSDPNEWSFPSRASKIPSDYAISLRWLEWNKGGLSSSE